MKLKRLLLIPSMLIAVGAGVASASVLIPGPPVGAGSSSSGPGETPGPGTPIVGATTSDPSGGPSWGVRVYKSQNGETCPTPGRLSLGRFGRYGDDGSFQELPVDASGACADLSKGGAALAVERYPAQGLRPARTVIYGSTAAPTDTVVLHDADGDHAVPSDRGTFIVIRSDNDLSGVTVTVTSDGKPQMVSLAASSVDPG